MGFIPKSASEVGATEPSKPTFSSAQPTLRRGLWTHTLFSTSSEHPQESMALTLSCIAAFTTLSLQQRVHPRDGCRPPRRRFGVVSPTLGPEPLSFLVHRAR